PFALEEVLEVFLVIFEAAVDARPTRSFSHATPIDHPWEIGLTVWEFYYNDGPNVAPSGLSPMPQLLVRAMAKKDLCDHFAFLLVDEVTRKLHGIILRCLKPIPVFVCALPDGEERFAIPDHSVLDIITREGDRLIMDGTPEQFGWSRSTWLLSWEDFEDPRMMRHRRIPYADGVDRAEMFEVIEEDENGYWWIVRRRMQDLFGEMNWVELGTLSQSERLDQVRRRAEEKF
ncbi:hypothetical protein P153DRAFT_259717, partial [Dothidotthia symphoricarpi CBS 119687]